MTNSSIHSPINYHHTRFITSAAAVQQLPSQPGIEIALVGRSNAGKSSVLNALTGQKKLARTSKIPGRTRLINLFQVVEGACLVDLPGYGYAEAPEGVKKSWQQSLHAYLYQRPQLCGLVVLMDIRHPLKALDQQMIQWAVDRPLPVLILLTKIDKLAPSIQQIQVNRVQEKVQAFKREIKVIGFSSLKRLGIEQLQQQLDQWFLAL